MNVVLIILAFICAVIGIIGSVAPGLPGPPIAWVGVLLLFFADGIDISVVALIITAVIAIAITLLDYLVPSAMTKRFGGSRAGVWGCNIGLIISIVGVPFGPKGLLGVIFWPFVGALVGEMLSKKDTTKALRAALGAFLGFITGTFAKLAYCIVTLIFMIVAVV